MKAGAWLSALLGVLLFVGAVYGRFHGASSVTLGGRMFSASGIMLAANTLLLLSIIVAQHAKK